MEQAYAGFRLTPLDDNTRMFRGANDWLTTCRCFVRRLCIASKLGCHRLCNGKLQATRQFARLSVIHGLACMLTSLNTQAFSSCSTIVKIFKVILLQHEFPSFQYRYQLTSFPISGPRPNILILIFWRLIFNGLRTPLHVSLT